MRPLVTDILARVLRSHCLSAISPSKSACHNADRAHSPCEAHHSIDMDMTLDAHEIKSGGVQNGCKDVSGAFTGITHSLVQGLW